MVKNIQPRFVSPKSWERIEQWSRRKPVFALMGEFSAGKSTLMNFLLRKRALPTQVTATQLPPVWFSWGRPSAHVKRHDGSVQDIDLNNLDQVGVNDAQFIRIFLEADILEAVDLIDTPGISDPKISTDVWRRAVGQANGVLWCTHSTQAWRETERATWVALPERLQHNSLLLVTRADALGQKDRQKVLRRVNREAGHLFNRSILFSARDAIMARDKTGDAELWSRSGGGKMIDSFLEITEQIMDNRADQLARYQIDRSLSDASKVQPLRPARNSDSVPLKLVTPLDDNPAGDGEVVKNFPIRPTRVERREEDSDRTRIDAEEAERLRAEMAPDETGDDIRAILRESDESPLDLNGLGNPATDVDEFSFMDDDEDAEDVDSLFNDTEEDSTSDLQEQSDETLNGAKASDEGEDETSDIETSVSSITALLSEQSSGSGDEYEPEPESNSLTAASVVAMPADQMEANDRHQPTDETAPALEHLLNGPAGSPLSASAMWREIVASEDLPDDAKGLQNAFTAFLNEFDQIALEHSSTAGANALRTIPRSNESNRGERHAL